MIDGSFHAFVVYECTEGKPSFLYADEKRVGLYSSYITEKKIATKLWALQNADNLFVDVNFDEVKMPTVFFQQFFHYIQIFH